MNRIRLLKNTTDFTDFEDLLHDFLDYAQKYMDLKQVPEIEFVHDEYNGKDILGKTAQYDPNSMEIHVYSYGRHPKDMLRSIAHELVHHMQNEQGRLNVGGYQGQGYAQKNPALREVEKEAMLKSNLCLRDWEDGLKEQKRTIYKEWRNNNMSLKEWKNKELNTLLVEKWGFGKIQEQVEEISEETLEEDEETLEEGSGDAQDMECIDRHIKDGASPTQAERNCMQDPTSAMEERLAKAIAEKLLQNESLLKKLRGK